MKLAAYTREGRARVGILSEDSVRELKGISQLTELLLALQDVPAQERVGRIEDMAGDGYARDRVSFSAPLVQPVKDILCVGLNYQEHVNESQSFGIGENRQAVHTTYFGKRCDWIRGDGAKIAIHAEVDPELDYEVELALVIGRGGRGIRREEALSYVFGYSIGNDFSSRSLQRNHKQWLLGKGLDGYTAMGPCILVNEDDRHQDFLLSSRVNGELRQDSTTALMIKSVEDIIVELSQAMSLVPGDIIFTGTPAGVGGGFTPPKYLKAGDVVELTIQGIGSLSNEIVAK